jgi:protein transport protein SEC24
MSNIHQKILKRREKETNVDQSITHKSQNPFSVKPQQTNSTPTKIMEEQKKDELLERYQEYNSSDDVVKFNVKNFPNLKDCKSVSFPLTVFIKPYNEGGLDIIGVDLISDIAPVNPAQNQKPKKDVPRCNECRAYVNPFFQFLENGHKMRCNLCGLVNPVPPSYYKGLDSNGFIKGFENSPELYSGSVEFIVNEDYSARTPKDPTYFFLIDISKSSYESNIPYYSIYAIKDAILNQRFNGGLNCCFGIGFFDGNIHMLDLKQKKPKLFTLYEINGFSYNLPREKFFIYLEDFDMEELADKIQTAYDNLVIDDNEASFEEISEAVKFTNNILTHQGGKIILIVGNNKEYLPAVDSKDKTNRHFFYSNENSFSKLSTDLNKHMASLELYCFGHKKMKNLASLSENIRLSGSTLCYYEDANEDSSILKSEQIFSRYYFQYFQKIHLGSCF